MVRADLKRFNLIAADYAPAAGARFTVGETGGRLASSHRSPTISAKAATACA
jgi:hypothetical protein